MRRWNALLAFCVLMSSGLALTPRVNHTDSVRQARSACGKPPAVNCDRLPDNEEFLVDTGITLVPAPNDESVPAGAFDGTNFLVVWQDYRSGSDWDIYGARVTPQGTVLDPTGFVISQATSDQCTPSVAFDGADFLVVWQDDRSGSDWDIYGARVTPQGTVLDPAGSAISQVTDDQCAPAVASDGTSFLVVWQDYRNDFHGDIYGARVTPQGTLLDPAGIVITQAASDQCSPALSIDGAGFLVAWQDHHDDFLGDIHGARVSSEGTVLDTTSIVISKAGNNQYSPAIAFDGDNCLVVWEDARSGAGFDIYGARVTPQGVVLDSAGTVVSRAARNQRSPALGFDGTDYLLAWRDYRSGSDWDIYGARVTPSGAVLDSAGIAVSTATAWQVLPTLAFGGASFLVAWQDSRGGGSYDIYGARVTPEGTVLDPTGFVISQATSDQCTPSVAFDGADFLVVWQDDRGGTDWDVYGARVSPEGLMLDSAAFAVSRATGDQCIPAVGFNGADFLVVWQDFRGGNGYDIYGARVTSQGMVVDTAGFAISRATNDQCVPSVASDGVNFLVVWEDYRGGSNYDIYGARVTPDGAVLDTGGLVISQVISDQCTPSVSFDGACFLIVWEDYRRSSRCDIYGARVTPEGTVLDSSGIGVSYANGRQESPALGFDGANSLVVWEDDRDGSSYDVYGARVTPEGTVLDPSGVAISTAPGNQEHPVVTTDGASLLVVWQDDRSGSDWDIYGARVTPEGAVSGTGSVVGQQGDQVLPRLCRGSGSQMLLAYQGWAGTIGGKGYNSFRIWGKVNPNPAVAEMTSPEVRMTYSGATIVGKVLVLGAVGSRQTTEYRAELLSIAGRKVLDLRPGANDIGRLSLGVYFVREAQGQAQAQSIRKVVVTK